MRFLMLNWRDPKNPLAGGAERVTQAYMADLARRGHEVYWFANSFPGCSETEDFDGVHFVRGGGKGTSIIKARRWFRGQQPFDLVIDQHHGIPWFAPWWCRTNCVSFIHEVLGPIWSVFYPWPVSSLGRWQERWTHWAYRNVQFWTASQCTKTILHSHGVKSVKLISYGVNTVALAKLDAKPLDQPLRLTVVSRLAPNKRIDHAIRTVKCLADRNVLVRLTIVGGGESREALQALTAELQLGDQVTFAGSLSEEEKDARLRGSHFLLHTSQREGWGLNVIEANAMGTPAAVYPVEGLIESTLHDQTGIVAEKETPESLASGLMTVLQSPEKYQAYRVAALERARTFHWSNVLSGSSAWFEAQAASKARPH